MKSKQKALMILTRLYYLVPTPPKQMNGDVHPLVTNRSQAEANAEFNRALDRVDHVV